jgi:protein gp37
MGQTSAIEWCDHTFNPWWGCVKVSPACDHCYAETFARRVGFSETGSKFPIWGKDEERRFFGDKHWDEPLKWNRAAEKAGERRRVFCGSMCDVMEEYSGDGHLIRETIAESRQWLYRLIERTPSLDWLLLTKRPQNFRKLLPAAWIETPRANVWGMTTVESADYLWRATELLRTPFAVRGLSVEPLLGPLDLSSNLAWSPRPWSGGDPWVQRINWVIAGTESGPGARPWKWEWLRSLKDQCVGAGVAFFLKQVTERGRKVTLPELDGKQWEEMPEVGRGR